MTDASLSDLDRRVLTEIQAGFPIEPRPYAVLSRQLDSTEAEVLASVLSMRAARLIRRIGAIFDSHALGYHSTLCAIAAPLDRVEEVAELISAYQNVTHNYEREDRYSVWFTLIAPTDEDIRRILREIAQATGIDDILDLPAIRLFKIRVQFDFTGEHRQQTPPRTQVPAEVAVARLSDRDKALVRLLQDDLPGTETPFDDLAQRLRSEGADADEAWVLERTREFAAEGVIRRFGAAVRHTRTGFAANAMGVWECPDEQVEAAGVTMASFPEVSHCYQRPRTPTWHGNLYTMIHGRTKADCEAVAERIREATGLKAARLLYSTREFKKSSMRYFEDD